jgi:hypothetical protein
MAWSVLALTGCPDGGGGGGGSPIATTPSNHGSGYGCTGQCPTGNDTFLRAGFGNDMGGFGSPLRSQLSIDLLGQDVPGAGVYVGPVFVAGSYWVERSEFYGCPIPQGRYNLETVSAGEVNSNGIFGNIGVRAIGAEGPAAGTVLEMLIVDGALNALSQSKSNVNGVSYMFGLWSNVRILAVNNGSCNVTSNIFFSYQY